MPLLQKCYLIIKGAICVAYGTQPCYKKKYQNWVLTIYNTYGDLATFGLLSALRGDQPTNARE